MDVMLNPATGSLPETVTVAAEIHQPPRPSVQVRPPATVAGGWVS